MRIGYRLPLYAEHIIESARTAEKVGFDSVWIGEAYNRGLMLVDPFIALGAAAAVTRRVELGTHVIQAPLRPPFLLASQVASVANMAQGRFVLGVGCGSTAVDFQAVGVDFRDRFKLLEDHVVVMRRLLAGEEVAGARLAPEGTSTLSVPLLVGAHGTGHWLQKAALEFDGWVASAYATDLEQLVSGLARFRDLADKKRAVVANVPADRPDAADVLAALADAGFDDATLLVERHDEESLEKARQLWCS